MTSALDGGGWSVLSPGRFTSGKNSLELVRNLMAQAHKPHFVFRLNGRVHLNWQGSQFSRLLADEVCVSALVMLDTPRSEVVWEYWLPTPFASFPFTSFPCVTVCHQVSKVLYNCYTKCGPFLGRRIDFRRIHLVAKSSIIFIKTVLLNYKPKP